MLLLPWSVSILVWRYQYIGCSFSSIPTAKWSNSLTEFMWVQCLTQFSQNQILNLTQAVPAAPAMTSHQLQQQAGHGESLTPKSWDHNYWNVAKSREANSTGWRPGKMNEARDFFRRRLQKKHLGVFKTSVPAERMFSKLGQLITEITTKREECEHVNIY